MNRVLIALVAATLFHASGIHAASESEPKKEEEPKSADVSGPSSYVGLQVGQGLVTSGGGNDFFNYGGRIGTAIFRDGGGWFSLGLYLCEFSSSATVSGIAVDQRFTAILLDAVTRRLGDTGFYLGGRFGIGLLSATVSGNALRVEGTGSSIVVGPVIGHEFTLSSNSALTAEVSWLVAGKGELNFSGIGVVPYDSSGAILLQLGLLYLW